MGVPYILLLGEDEITQRKASLKDMRTGEQELLSAAEIIERIRLALASSAALAPIREPEN